MTKEEGSQHWSLKSVTWGQKVTEAWGSVKIQNLSRQPLPLSTSQPWPHWSLLSLLLWVKLWTENSR